MPSYPPFQPREGFMTDSVRAKFLAYAMRTNLVPADSAITLRHPDIVPLVAPADKSKPVQFWQLYSILGERPVMAIVSSFYSKIYENMEPQHAWFREAFSRISGKDHHIATQAAMWLDCFGAGSHYHGGEYRLNFHHQHNAMQVMTQDGALRWIELMEETLDQACDSRNLAGMRNTGGFAAWGVLVRHFNGDMEQVKRVRSAINTFLGYFMDDYAKKFNFKSYSKKIAAEVAAAAAASTNTSTTDGAAAATTTSTTTISPSTPARKHKMAFGERNPAVGVDGFPLQTAAGSSSNSNNNNNNNNSTNKSTTTTTTIVEVNLKNLSEQQIRSMKASELKAALIRHKIDVSDCLEKDQLIAKALNLCC